MEDRRARLAEHIRRRRLSLGLSEREAAKIAGIARNTWSGAEKATSRTAAHTWPGIERALAWAPGSIERILAGDEPAVRQSAATASPPTLSDLADIDPDEIADAIFRADISPARKRQMVQWLDDLVARAGRLPPSSFVA